MVIRRHRENFLRFSELSQDSFYYTSYFSQCYSAPLDPPSLMLNFSIFSCELKRLKAITSLHMLAISITNSWINSTQSHTAVET